MAMDINVNPNGLVYESEKDPNLTRSFERFFGQEDIKKDLGTEQFLTSLYSYPPRISVYHKIDEEDSSNTGDLIINDLFYSFLSSDKFAISRDNRFPGFKNLRPLLLSEPKIAQEMSREIVPKYSYSKLDYLNGYLNKKFLSSFLTNITKPLKKALETTPVYVVLNGQDEIVLVHETNFGDPVAPNSKSSKIYDFCGAFADNGTLKKGKLGLVFFNYNDAKTFMDATLELEPDEARIVGLAIHCVSLDSVYQLMRSNHPGTDFRLIPNTKDLLSSFALVEDSRFLFQEELRKPKVDFINEYGDRDLSDLNGSPLQNLTKGVPVYSVQLQEDKRGIVKGALRSAISKVDSLASFFLRPHKLGRKTMKGQLPENYDTKTYLFFDYRKALDFCKKNDRFVVRLSGSYLGPRFDSFVQKPIIFVTNLETLLEQWENDALEVSHNKSLGSNNIEIRELWHTLKFVPFKESKTPGDIEKIKLLNSPIRKMCREIKVRYKILSSFLEYVWLA